jgi:hypothetical protein
MKKSLLSILIIQISIFSFSQTTNPTTPQDQIVQVTNSVFKFGIGLGYRINTGTVNDPFISPIDSTLQFQKLPGGAFVISATAVFHLGSTEQPKVLSVQDGKASLTSVKAYQQRKGKNKLSELLKDATGDEKPKQESPFSIMISLNVADISSNGASFDKPIDGGVGLGYKIGENIHLGFFVDCASYRQLRGYYVQNYQGIPIMVNGQKLGALDATSDTYFYSRPVISLALKFVATLGNDASGKN